MKTEIYWVKYRLELMIELWQTRADHYFKAFNESKHTEYSFKRLTRFLLRAKRYQNRVRGMVMAYDLIVNLESEVN